MRIDGLTTCLEASVITSHTVCNRNRDEYHIVSTERTDAMGRERWVEECAASNNRLYPPNRSSVIIMLPEHMYSSYTVSPETVWRPPSLRLIRSGWHHWHSRVHVGFQPMFFDASISPGDNSVRRVTYTTCDAQCVCVCMCACLCVHAAVRACVCVYAACAAAECQDAYGQPKSTPQTCTNRTDRVSNGYSFTHCHTGFRPQTGWPAMVRATKGHTHLKHGLSQCGWPPLHHLFPADARIQRCSQAPTGRRWIQHEQHVLSVPIRDRTTIGTRRLRRLRVSQPLRHHTRVSEGCCRLPALFHWGFPGPPLHA